MRRQHEFDKNLSRLDAVLVDDIKETCEEMDRKLKNKSKVQVEGFSNPPAPARGRARINMVHKLGYYFYKRI